MQYQGTELTSTIWISRDLEPREVNHSVTEKEFMAVVWVIKKFRIYLGREFVLMTDHKAIEGIMNKKETTPRLTRMRMMVQ